MNLPFRRKAKLPYSQDELADHIGLMGDLIIKRERALQHAILKRSDGEQQKYLHEVDRYDTMIETAQRSLSHMLDRNLQRIKGERHA